MRLQVDLKATDQVSPLLDKISKKYEALLAKLQGKKTKELDNLAGSTKKVGVEADAAAKKIDNLAKKTNINPAGINNLSNNLKKAGRDADALAGRFANIGKLAAGINVGTLGTLASGGAGGGSGPMRVSTTTGGAEVAGQAADLYRTNQIQRSIASMNRPVMADSMRSITGVNNDAIDNFIMDMARAEDEFRNFSNTLNQSSFGRGLNTGNSILEQAEPIGQKSMNAGAIGVTAMAAAVAVMVPFETKLAEISTIIDTTKVNMDEFKVSIQDMAIATGQSTGDLAQALYDAISSGIDAGEAIEFMGVASKTAVAGVTTTTSAVNGLTNVINSYGLSTTDAMRVSDMMFQAVKDGKFNFEQLSNSLYNVTPAAAAAGISLEEVLAGLSTMTAQGVPISEATTRMTSAIQGMVGGGKEMQALWQELGYSSGTAAIEALGFAGALAKVNEAANGDAGQLQNLLGRIEAVQTAQILGGTGSEFFSESLDNMSKSAGQTEQAFDKMQKTTGNKLAKLKEQFLVIIQVIGEHLLPVVKKLANILLYFGKKLQAITESRFGEWLTNMFASISARLFIFGLLIVSLVRVGAAFKELMIILTWFKALTGNWSGVLIGIAGLAALGINIGISTAATKKQIKEQEKINAEMETGAGKIDKNTGALKANTDATQELANAQGNLAKKQDEVSAAMKDIEQNSKDILSAEQARSKAITDAYNKIIDKDEEIAKAEDDKAKLIITNNEKIKKSEQALSDARVNALQKVVDAQEALENKAKSAEDRLIAAQLKMMQLSGEDTSEIEEYLEQKKAIEELDIAQKEYLDTKAKLKEAGNIGATAKSDLEALKQTLADTDPLKTDNEVIKAKLEGIQAVADAEQSLFTARQDAKSSEEEADKRIAKLYEERNKLQAEYNELVLTDDPKILELMQKKIDLQTAYNALLQQEADIKKAVADAEIAKANEPKEVKVMTEDDIKKADENYENAKMEEQDILKNRPFDYKAHKEARQKTKEATRARYGVDKKPRDWSWEAFWTGRFGREKDPDISTQFMNNQQFRASGGMVSAGQSYVIGERGPEIFSPSTSGTIIPNIMAQKMTGYGSGNNQNIITIRLDKGLLADSASAIISSPDGKQAVIRIINDDIKRR